MALRTPGTRAQDPLLLFYDSGHSDEQRVFPQGKTLELSQLRDYIARSPARLRIAILDACRGGENRYLGGFSVSW